MTRRIFLSLSVLTLCTFLSTHLYAGDKLDTADNSHVKSALLLHEREVRIDHDTLLVCEDGTSFKLDPHSGISPNNIVVAKQDGPIVYAQDDHGKIYSFEYDNKDKILKRTQIFRLPVIGKIYSLFWDSKNLIQLPYKDMGTYAKWAISYFTFPEGLNVRTISLFIMTQTNPIILRNMDPWLPPWNCYDHKGPQGVVGVDLAAGHERVAVIGYQKGGQKVVAYRSLNYDLTGGNPLIYYRLLSGYIRTPTYLMKKLAEYIGVTASIIDIPVPDWKIVPISDKHFPKIYMAELGNHLIIPKEDGMASVYDCVEECWLDDVKKEFSEPFLRWPDYVPPKKGVLKTIKAYLNGIEGTFAPQVQEPLVGTFTSEQGGQKNIYALSPSILAMLMNTKYFYDDKYNLVDLKFLKD